MVNNFRTFFKNKKNLILIFGLGVVLSLTPLYSAQAAWWDDVIAGLTLIFNVLANIPVVAATWPLLIIAIVGPFIVGIIFTLNLILLRLAINGDIVHLNFTSGGIVDSGLAATTTLVNLGFILVLVVIALATILRRENYGLKKLLPKFLLIVILINFVPVISGAIIDIANVVTKSFLDFDILATFSSIFNPFAGDIKNAQGIAKAIQGGDADWVEIIVDEISSLIGLTGTIQRMITGFSMIFFGLFSSFVFFLYFMLFLLRYIAIWILVILAPIAWFCSILPNTQKFFKMWWGYFIQWAFVGAIAGFFLKLGSTAASTLNSGFGASNPNICSDCWYSNIVTPFFATINSMFLSAAVTIFLIIGFILSLKLSGGGTEMVLNWGAKNWKTIGGLAASQTLGRALTTKRGAEIMKRFEKTGVGFRGLPKNFQEWKKAPLWKKALSGAAAPFIAPVNWGLKAGAKQALIYGAKQSGSVDARTAQIEKDFGKDFSGAEATYNNINPLDWQGKIAMASYLAKTKGGKALGALDKTQLYDSIKTTAKHMPHKLEDIVKHMPDLVENSEVGEIIRNTMTPIAMSKKEGVFYDDSDMEKELRNYPADPKTMQKNATYKKLTDAMKTNDIETTSETVMENEGFRTAVVKWKDSQSFISKMLDTWGTSTAQKLQEQAKKIDTSLEKIAKTNPTFLGMPYSPAGRQTMSNWEVGGNSLNQSDIRNLITSTRIIAGSPELANIYKLIKELKPLENNLKIEREALGSAIRELNAEKGKKSSNTIINKIQIDVDEIQERVNEYQRKLNDGRQSVESFKNTSIEPYPERKEKLRQLENTLKRNNINNRNRNRNRGRNR